MTTTETSLTSTAVSVPPPTPTLPSPPAVSPELAGANLLAPYMQLAAVSFRTASAQGIATRDTWPDQPDMQFDGVTRFLRPTVDRTGELLTSEATFVFRLVGQWPSGVDETMATVRATMSLKYRVVKAPAEIPEQAFRDFVLCYVPFHAWGYWREFVQSSLARLELPVLTLPLFRVQQATELVIDHLDPAL